MKYYVRAREFGSDTATYYWDSGRHEWSTLAEATVVNEDDLKEFNIGSDAGNMRVGYANISTHFPAGRWEELPLVLTLRTREDLNAVIDRRVEDAITAV